MGDLSPHFSRYEFVCKCGCGFFIKDALLIQWLEKMREELGVPIIINSGCRCKPWNTFVEGNKASEHLDGQAADIRVTNGYERSDVVLAALNAGFRRIGIAKSFVHVDTDIHKPQDVIWVYS
jgi:uncharacterized protein YcbK (DUF882 family)